MTSWFPSRRDAALPWERDALSARGRGERGTAGTPLPARPATAPAPCEGILMEFGMGGLLWGSQPAPPAASAPLGAFLRVKRAALSSFSAP